MRTLTLTVAAAAVMALTVVAQAAPLNLNQVAADAKWVAHVDVDAMKAASVVQKAYDKHVDAHPGAEQRLAMVSKLIGMNPTKDLASATLYGTQLKKDTGVLLVNATVDGKLLGELVKKAPDYRTSTYGKHTLHSWTAKKGKDHEHPVTGVLAAPTVLVFGRTAAEVMAALDILDGKLPSLEGSDSPLAAEAPAGTIVLARAVGLSEAKLPCKSPLVKLSESFCMALGENEGKSFLKAKLVTKSTETADQVKAIAEGFRAMAALHKSEDADAQKVLKAVKVDVDGTAVALTVEVPADEVWEMCQKAEKKIREHGWPKHWKRPPHFKK